MSAELERIADTATLATLRDYLHYKRNPLSSTADCTNASERDAGPSVTSASDQRLREPKNCIVRDEKEEKSQQQTEVSQTTVVLAVQRLTFYWLWMLRY